MAMDDRAPLLPERARDVETASGSGRRGRRDGAGTRARDVARAVGDAYERAKRRADAIVGACEREEVCEGRTRRVRTMAAVTLGAMVICAAGATTTSASPRGVARLGSAGGDWTSELIRNNALDVRKLDFGSFQSDVVREVHPDRTGGLAKRWAQEYDQVTQPEIAYDPHFGQHRVSLINNRASAAIGASQAAVPSPVPVAPARLQTPAALPAATVVAPKNADFVGDFVGDMVNLVKQGSIEKQYENAPDLGKTIKPSDDISLADLMVDADHAEKHKTGKSWVRDEPKAKTVEHNSHDKESSSKGKETHVKHVEKPTKKSTMKSTVKRSEADDSRLKSSHASSKKSNKLDSMVFNELSFNRKKKPSSLKERVQSHLDRLMTRARGSGSRDERSSRGSGKLKQYPHHIHDVDENDANDVNVFYKQKDLLDLGEYDQDTIDDFKYGRGLTPRGGSGRLDGLTVDTNIDISNYPATDGTHAYPSRSAKTGKHEEENVDMDDLMSSLQVTSKDASKHVEHRKRDRATENKKKPSAKASRLSDDDWSDAPPSTSKQSPHKSKKASALSDDDWSDEPEKSKKTAAHSSSSVSTNKKASTKSKSLDWNDAPEPTVKASTHTESRSSDISGAKVGKMSEAAAAKYLSKVKGHNEKTHEKLRRSIPKLGVEEEVNDAYDAIDEDSEEDGHNIRHENVAKVVEAAEMQNEASGSGIPREAALGRKQSERRGLQPATNEELQQGGAWRKVFNKVFHGNHGNRGYEKAREQIFSSDEQ